jgi:hypothetical protein
LVRVDSSAGGFSTVTVGRSDVFGEPPLRAVKADMTRVSNNSGDPSSGVKCTD